ncbi:helix-turn-helix domain-containing protein [Pseudoneobacillus sp. C159]
MDNLVKIVGEQIRIIRKNKELSQEELAEISGLHNTHIGKIERGEMNLTLESLVKVTKALGVSLEEFFSLIDPKLNVDNEVLLKLIELIKSRSLKEQSKILEILSNITEMVD